ncbi:MAG: TetR family transcriptional regulator [Caulobacterales bacterium]
MGLTIRDGRKQATRQRVLDAARDLFEEVGYDETTIRAIAKRAEVSVGSVFTSFASKAHVLSEVMRGRLDALYGELERVWPHMRGSTADRCRSLFAVHYAFELRRARLFIAFVGASFTWFDDPTISRFGSTPRLRAMVAETLREGVTRGEVRPDTDFERVVDLLLAAYTWNYRLVAPAAPDAAPLIERMDHQIGVIFEGLAPR